MEELFNQLEDELSKQGIFARRIDLDKCLEIVHTLRKNYDYAINEANHIMQTRNEILTNADALAKKKLKEVENRSFSGESGHYIYRTRDEEADGMYDKTLENCEELFANTKGHIDKLFCEIEDYLLSMVDLIRKNREELKSLKFKAR